MTKQRIVCACLCALLLLGAFAPYASALGEQPALPDAAPFALGNTSEMMLAGGGRMVQADGVLYFLGAADSFIYRSDGETTSLVWPMAAQCLNYINGTLYFASATEEDGFTVYRTNPETLATEPLLPWFDGSLKQLYVTGEGELWFLADDTIWYAEADGAPEAVRTEAELWSFVPTQYGPIYARGSLFDYDLYFGDLPIVRCAEDYYVMQDTEQPRLVYHCAGEDLQIPLALLAEGCVQPEPFTGYETVSSQELLDEVQTDEEPPAIDELPELEKQPELTRGDKREAISRPATPGMIKIALRGYQMTDVQWTPVKTVQGWTRDNGVTVYYQAGTTYTGIPYGWPYDVGGYVPWDKSLGQFVTAVSNGNSDFYTKRSSVRNGLSYATDCSGFVSWAWDMGSRRTCTGIRADNRCSLVSRTSFATAEIGDCLLSSSHTMLITNIKYNSAGVITAIEVAEANPTSAVNFCSTRRWYGEGGSSSLSSLQWVFGSGYCLYRNLDRESVRFTEDPNVTVAHDAPSRPISNAAELHRGMDVSYAQGEIDWATVSKNVEFAIIRCSYGTKLIDSQFLNNIKGCEEYGVPYGIYVYALALNAAEAMNEAGMVIEQLAALGYTPDLPIFYDVEEEKGNLSLPDAKLLSVVSAFCQTIEDVGYRAGVYCSTSWWSYKLSDSAYSKWCRWVAQIFRYCEYKDGMNMWQYSWTGSVPGIKGGVDLDCWYGELGDESHMYVMDQPYRPSCTQPGYNTYNSTDGKVSWNEELAPLGHDWGEWTVTQTGSCTQDGVREHTCARCGETETEALPATGHTYTQTVVPPTCTEQGYTTHVCQTCGDRYDDDYVDAPGHIWDGGTVTTEPTKELDGVITFTCSRCGGTKTEPLPKLDHDHQYENVLTPPTCTAQGYVTHTCTICGASYVDSYIPALEHDWGEWAEVKAPTCLEAGMEQRICQRCGETESRVGRQALGHDWGEWFTEAEATCTEPGKESRVCARCSETESREIPPAGHDFVDGFCTVCGEEQPISFLDVREGTYYYDAVRWAVKQNITTGTGENTFSPDDNCTRAQVVTFLYRAAKASPVKDADGAFDDVPEGAWYSEAVAWAVANGITTGTGNRTFSPNDKCTRAQVVTFLYRALKASPVEEAAVKFSDVADGQWYSDAVSWAVAQGVTTGTGGDRFSPALICTRSQVVTFLYRALADAE